MVSEKDLEQLRSLAGEYRIQQRLQDHEWPLAHRSVFETIEKLGRMTIQDYISTFDGSSIHQPWKKQNRMRAEWLVKQAGRLSLNTANESSWRMRVENAILERFSVEVACPNCKYRLWRSEIEVDCELTSRTATKLAERRARRKSCKCPLEDRPSDRYELGMSELFEERVEETVISDSRIREVLKQRPDRVIGLRTTNRFRELLARPPHPELESSAERLQDLVRTTPFKARAQPLLYPFLVLEAKSDTASCSFSDIQSQTAFPIWTLLSLQNDLRGLVSDKDGIPESLVWFFGYRGSDWKIYGCYMSHSRNAEPVFNIHLLNGGDIATKNGAIQLLLILDFIVDWARDYFRPSIMGQLLSLTTGQSFDQVSLAPDTDIASMMRTKVSEWMSNPSKTVVRDATTFGSDVEDDGSSVHDDLPLERLPNTEFGAVRCPKSSTLRIAGLRLTEGNVESVLSLTAGCDDHEVEYGEVANHARKLLGIMTCWDEVLVVTGADLDSIENSWTGGDNLAGEPMDEGPGSEYFAVFECRVFFDTSWDVIRELSYLAISRSAFQILLRHAAYQVRNKNAEVFSESHRPCESNVIREGIECLRSGSPWQVILMALSSTVILLSPEPERKRHDVTVPVSFLGTNHPRSIRVRSCIDVYLKLADVYFRPILRDCNGRRVYDNTPRKKRKRSTRAKRTFRRQFEVVEHMSGIAHAAKECKRCTASEHDLFQPRHLNQEDLPPPTAYGAILVVSLHDEKLDQPSHQSRHDISLFVFEEQLWLENSASISVVIDDLAQSGFAYHTICHDRLKKQSEITGWLKEAVLWNLPLPYRKMTARQRFDVLRFSRELSGSPIPKHLVPYQCTYPWVHQQILLYYLWRGIPYDVAILRVIDARDDQVREHCPDGFPAIPDINPEWTALTRFWAARIREAPLIQNEKPGSWFQSRKFNLRDPLLTF